MQSGRLARPQSKAPTARMWCLATGRRTRSSSVCPSWCKRDSAVADNSRRWCWPRTNYHIGTECRRALQNGRCTGCSRSALSSRDLTEYRDACYSHKVGRKDRFTGLKSSTERLMANPARLEGLGRRRVALLKLAFTVTVAHFVAIVVRARRLRCRHLDPRFRKTQHFRTFSEFASCILCSEHLLLSSLRGS